MKIVIATPLYPPEIAESSIYSKKLAEELSKNGNDVTVITYSSIPEKIFGVKIVSINKKQPLPIRLFFYTKQLLQLAKQNNILYTQNGPSTELPMLIVSFLTKKPFIIHLGDEGAYKHAHNNFFLNYIQNTTFNRAYKKINESPLERPEILPFKPVPTEKLLEYEKSWKEHIDSLIKIFKNVK